MGPAFNCVRETLIYYLLLYRKLHLQVHIIDVNFYGLFFCKRDIVTLTIIL